MASDAASIPTISRNKKMKTPAKKPLKKPTSGRAENARIHEAALALLVNLGSWAGAKQILKCALALLERVERKTRKTAR
jgi:hypothetical protein